MYWESHGKGDPVVCMGGWGTYCHGAVGNVPDTLLENYSVIVFDYRGVGESDDPSHDPPCMELHAADAAALCDELGLAHAHVVGLVGMGGCVGQELAIARPDLVRSLTLMGTWARADEAFADQLALFKEVHLGLGFAAFQKFAASFSFSPSFYARKRERILGPNGAWKDLCGRAEAHARLVDACISHDTVSRLRRIQCPTMVIHAGADVLTGPWLTAPLEEGIPGAHGVTLRHAHHVVAARDERVALAAILADFLRSVEEGESSGEARIRRPGNQSHQFVRHVTTDDSQ